MMSDYDRYRADYSEDSFWQKIKQFAKKAGQAVIRRALILYYCLQDPDTPTWAKGTILGALGYFISPLDAIPDLTPGVGFTDDFGVLGAALLAVTAYIKPEHEDRADQKLSQWFG